MAYVVKSTEKVRGIGADYETKAMLYLISCREDSNEIYFFAIDFYNDVTGLNRHADKSWDIQSKGTKSGGPKEIGREAVTLFKNFMSDFHFDYLILFLACVPANFRKDKTLITFGIDNVSERALKSLREGLVEEANKQTYIENDWMPHYKEEFLNVVNEYGEKDRILLLHIEMSVDQVIRTYNDSTYLRIGDRTKELRGDDLRNLEYSKSMRHYEDECSMDAELEDLDTELLEQYRHKINADNDSFEQILSARGFLKRQQGMLRLTNAAVLLFAKNIQQFYPNCRVRFIRYDGTSAGVGIHLNVTKDVNVEQPLLKIIDKAQEFIGTQLREFTALDGKTGKFKTVPEYPEFAWKEGIVNAVTHREYAMSGSYIKVSMYDDRLEIESPGRLPNIVTIENIKETRFARNPRISRVLTEFGWVRELNEGVKRIYSDMAELFLDEPIYSEPDQGVRLILKNNIVARSQRQTTRAAENVGVEQWNDLDDLEHLILTLMSSRGTVKRSDIEQYTGKSGKTVNTRLKHLLNLNIIIANGNKYDPKRTYALRLDN